MVCCCRWRNSASCACLGPPRPGGRGQVSNRKYTERVSLSPLFESVCSYLTLSHQTLSHQTLSHQTLSHLELWSREKRTPREAEGRALAEPEPPARLARVYAHARVGGGGGRFVAPLRRRNLLFVKALGPAGLCLLFIIYKEGSASKTNFYGL